MIPVRLGVSVSASVEHHSVVRTLGVSFHHVLRCGEVAGLHGSFCVHAAVGGVAVVLWLLAEGLARRLTLGVEVMPVDLRTLVLVRVVLRRVRVKVGVMLVYKQEKNQSSGVLGFFPH